MGKSSKAKSDSRLAPRELRVPDDLAVQLAELRSASESTGVSPAPAELDIELIQQAEAALEITLPDSILAIFAAHVPFLEEGYQMDLENLPSLAEDAEKVGCKKGLVPIGREPQGIATYICIPRDHDGTITHVTSFRAKPKATHKIALADWIEGIADAILDDSESEVQDRDFKRMHEPKPFRAKLTGGARDPAARNGKRRITHPKFGDGVVVREVADSADRKLEIQFSDGNTRVLFERFVTALD